MENIERKDLGSLPIRKEKMTDTDEGEDSYDEH